MSEFYHVSVLLDECIQALNIKPDGIYVDGTMGGGGHFDVAGAAIADSTIEAAKAKLIAAIDEYLADIAQNSK